MTRANIRDFAPHDLPRLHEIRTIAFAPVFASFRDLVGGRLAELAFASAEEDQGKWLDTICAPGSGHDVIVAERDGQIVGFASFAAKDSEPCGEIGLNAVDPEHAGRGIGLALYGEAISRLKHRGVLAVEVSTGADPSHAPARRAYEKAGFKPGIPAITFYRWLGD